MFTSAGGCTTRCYSILLMLELLVRKISSCPARRVDCVRRVSPLIAACGVLFAASPFAWPQSPTGTISGRITDSKAKKAVPAALVIATQTGAIGFAARTKSGGDGEFQLTGLPAGRYSLCVQAGDDYLDPCQWDDSPTNVNLKAGETDSGVSIKLTAASTLLIRVDDTQKLLTQKTKDGRKPELTLGVWGPKGIFYPARPHSTLASGPAPGAASGVVYRVAVPRDTALKFHIRSRDLKLGDASGAALPTNASQQAFQHATGDSNPKSFAFAVLGLLP